MSSTFSILFVCLGNICRSPMAEAAFKNEVSKRDLNIFVDSVGLGPWHINEPPDSRTIQEVARHGIDIHQYRGRQIGPNDFKKFTHIIGMDHKNIEQLKKIAPSEDLSKISLFMDYIPGEQGKEVADPYYGDQSAFEATWNIVSLGVTHIANYFEKKK